MKRILTRFVVKTWLTIKSIRTGIGEAIVDFVSRGNHFMPEKPPATTISSKQARKLRAPNFSGGGGWSFAIVNNRLAEIFFYKKKGEPVIWGHCYVQKTDYKTKREQAYIRNDTARLRFSYRNKRYRKMKVT